MGENPFQAPQEGGAKPLAPPFCWRWQLSALRVGCLISWLFYFLPIAVGTAFVLICVAKPAELLTDAGLAQARTMIYSYFAAGFVLLAATIAVFVAARHR